MKPLIASASLFARHAHHGQARKYTGEPYFNHVETVALMVMRVNGATPEMVAAAYLHDVVEDTPRTLDDVRAKYGETVAHMVDVLTDPVYPEPRPNRKARVALQRDRLAAAPWAIQTIKLADLIDNTGSIVEHDPKFARVYLAEKFDLLGSLMMGDRELWNRAMTQVAAGLQKVA